MVHLHELLRVGSLDPTQHTEPTTGRGQTEIKSVKCRIYKNTTGIHKGELCLHSLLLRRSADIANTIWLVEKIWVSCTWHPLETLHKCGRSSPQSQRSVHFPSHDCPLSPYRNTPKGPKLHQPLLFHLNIKKKRPLRSIPYLAVRISMVPFSFSSLSFSKYMSFESRSTNQRIFQLRRDKVDIPPPFL